MSEFLSRTDLLGRLRRVEVDAAISYGLEFPDDILFEPLASLPPQILVSSEHSLAGRDAVSFAELDGQPMLPFTTKLEEPPNDS